MLCAVEHVVEGLVTGVAGQHGSEHVAVLVVSHSLTLVIIFKTKHTGTGICSNSGLTRRKQREKAHNPIGNDKKQYFNGLLTWLYFLNFPVQSRQ